MSIEAFYIILTGALVAASSALLGSFLVLRRMAMLGDAISHAVLPGIVIAFLISGHRESLSLLIGAAASGLLATFLIELLHRKARLQEDASIGISFTWLFAIGVLLISAYTGQVDLDQECVLYGEIAYVPLDQISFGGLWTGPRPVLISATLFVLTLAYIIISFKGLKLLSFNEDHAKSLGIRTQVWHFSFMAMVSLVTVLAFEIVGAILIVALLVVPAATAFLWTRSLVPMLILAVVLGIAASAGGYYLALGLNGSIAGAMVSVAGIFLAITVLLKVLVQKKA
ncbi:metal ABC transporter permease [Croceimicrobium hydrocarbonivorans]|uniref:metal ABC transporter permease n=1 Tax=Croceimicrobium hydrocarbonivorans TaxID=2761580 RepID=UPI001FE2A310|nr:metal ABC transporter permease [Croceimicrobium hydrocarbonivorans]